MSIWIRISDFIAGKATTALSGLVESVRTAFAGDPATRRRVAFSIAMIALSAKMAKADGIVTNDEVDAFREIFEIPSEEARRVSGLYNLAKQDVAGYEAYARQIAGLCGSGEADCPLLIDVIDGLFHIAKADGVVHRTELQFLTDIAGIFGISGNGVSSGSRRGMSMPGAAIRTAFSASSAAATMPRRGAGIWSWCAPTIPTN